MKKRPVVDIHKDLKPSYVHYNRFHMSVAIRRLLFDALKPRETSIVELAQAVGCAGGVEGVDIIVSEVDSKTETIKLTIKGPQIDHDAVTKVMTKYGISIRGVDEISVANTNCERDSHIS